MSEADKDVFKKLLDAKVPPDDRKSVRKDFQFAEEAFISWRGGMIKIHHACN
jgi:hypothetical protein